MVPDTQLTAPPAACCTPSRSQKPPTPGLEDHLRVREMLTYLSATLPRFSSPTARLLALQCALRADSYGRVHLPGGLLRSMRLAGYAAPWHELAHADWLHYSSPTTRRAHGGVTAQLLDACVLTQAPTRSGRARAAHWALHLIPLATAREAPPAVQLTALALAAHTAGRSGSAEADLLTRLCGPQPGRRFARPPHSRPPPEQLATRRGSWRAALATGRESTPCGLLTSGRPEHFAK
ncbi:hypothetical protein [Streptomyces sp. NPDC048644]|uniref:hypothetical protein n=1 Tax=Streptomyces sp. NPDC048644 TaxID=3365582 RepID=UPI0037137FD0